MKPILRTALLALSLMLGAAACGPGLMQLLMGMTIRIGTTVLTSAAGSALSNLLDGLFMPEEAAGVLVDRDNPLMGRPQQPLVIEMNNVYGQAAQSLGTVRIDPDDLVLVRESRFSHRWVLSEGSQRHVQQVKTYAGAQVALQARGFAPGRVDGKWGPKSRGALRQFQRAQHLSATGELDPSTEARLLGF